MRPIGFSTGALAAGDFRRGLELLQGSNAAAVELSALRELELGPLLEALPDLQLNRFQFVSIHAPSRLCDLGETELVAALETVSYLGWPLVVHADVIHNYAAWRRLGSLLCVENQDCRKRFGKTAEELKSLFLQLPDASFCLDLAHTRQLDRTMSQADEMIRAFSTRLRLIHISEVDSAGHHLPLTQMSSMAYRSLASLLPSSIPVMIESVVEASRINLEIERVASALHPAPTRALTA